MILKYNGYSFNENTTVPSIRNSFIHDTIGRRARKTKDWTVRTMIQASSQSDIKTAIEALETKMVDGYDLVLYHNNGSTESPHKIENASTISGCRILSIDYPEGTGPEYANRRTIEIIFQAIEEVDRDDSYISFSETCSFSGGGPRIVWKESISGSPKKFQVANETIYYATQRGNAAAYSIDPNTYPSPPAPIWPGDLIDQNPRIEESPAVQNLSLSTYELSISWEYNFASILPFAGHPNTWA